MPGFRCQARSLLIPDTWHLFFRGVAQPGGALGSGSRGPRVYFYVRALRKAWAAISGSSEL